jgi:hypothetical protein
MFWSDGSGATEKLRAAPMELARRWDERIVNREAIIVFAKRTSILQWLGNCCRLYDVRIYIMM